MFFAHFKNVNLNTLPLMGKGQMVGFLDGSEEHPDFINIEIFLAKCVTVCFLRKRLFHLSYYQ
jgi:hypothetical protein